jgi:hypothetical protein
MSKNSCCDKVEEETKKETKAGAEDEEEDKLNGSTGNWEWDCERRKGKGSRPGASEGTKAEEIAAGGREKTSTS